MTRSAPLFLMAALAGLGACSQGASDKQAQGTTPPAPAASPPTPSAPQRAPASGAGQGAPTGLTLQAVNSAAFSPQVATPAPGAGAQTPTASLLKAEILLDRARVSPGVIDGEMGENVKNAFSAYQGMHGLPVTGQLDQVTWNSLATSDKAPVLKTYTITAADVAGPWSPSVGENFVKMSQQKAMGYSSPLEMLAERFHMDQALVQTLNPGADFSKAGTVLTVADPGDAVLPAVDHIKVDKAKAEVVAYGQGDSPVAVFPATVGSTERPSPKGTWKIKGVAQNPDYVYNPAKLHWGPRHAGKLHIPPGPNGPVGVVWIALTAPDYGIHGTPDPHLVGKTASHGCVRLTNWDAEALSKAVRPGVKVTFASG